MEKRSLMKKKNLYALYLQHL